jgi:hypothetical protein
LFQRGDVELLHFHEGLHHARRFGLVGIHQPSNMDKMVGGDFEAGLANLKTVAESR